MKRLSTIVYTLSTALFLALAGCVGPVQVAEGNDVLVVHAEWTAENSLNSVDQFLSWERENETALLKKSPGIHVVADSLRETLPIRLKELRQITRQYRADKSAANGDRVQASINAVLNIANSVRAHMGLPPLELPPQKRSVRDLMKNAPTNAPPEP